MARHKGRSTRSGRCLTPRSRNKRPSAVARRRAMPPVSGTPAPRTESSSTARLSSRSVSSSSPQSTSHGPAALVCQQEADMPCPRRPADVAWRSLRQQRPPDLRQIVVLSSFRSCQFAGSRSSSTVMDSASLRRAQQHQRLPPTRPGHWAGSPDGSRLDARGSAAFSSPYCASRSTAQSSSRRRRRCLSRRPELRQHTEPMTRHLPSSSEGEACRQGKADIPTLPPKQQVVNKAIPFPVATAVRRPGIALSSRKICLVLLRRVGGKCPVRDRGAAPARSASTSSGATASRM